MTEVQKQFVTKVKVLKLGGVKAYRGWKELCGGYNNIGATEVDFKNFVRDIKTYIGNFDAQMFVENLIGRKDTCSSFYFDFIVDENKCLAGVFWADPICIKNYMLFGEVLSADATYRTNKYDMVFVPFTGS
ncbi:protein FAR1-RELATED SEQUENCE 5-like [Silene latifolia]|uniref:protein FAR1-RELATED SEQUENCE 5-like n=1 Tax=Silene latifolia TaxID=37657 RepID=UPI003D783BF9